MPQFLTQSRPRPWSQFQCRVLSRLFFTARMDLRKKMPTTAQMTDVDDVRMMAQDVSVRWL